MVTPEQREQRIWEMAKTLSEVHTEIMNIKEKLDKLPCERNTRMLTELDTKVKIFGGLAGLIGAGIWELVSKLWRG